MGLPVQFAPSLMNPPPRPPEDVVRVAQEALRRELGRRVPDFEPYPTIVIPEGVTYFASGSDAGESMGMVEIGIAPGFSAADCAGKRDEPTDCEVGIMQLAGMGFPIFLDSGAVSEARQKKKVSDKEWARRFAFYERVARAHPGGAYLVAPDKLGDQKESLRRIKKFAALFRKLQRAPFRARVLVPIQAGRMSPQAYFREAKKILGPKVTPAIPWRKGAGWDLGMLEDFLARERPKSLHMLGLGPGGRSQDQVVDLVSQYIPRAEVSWDARLAQRAIGVGSGLQPYSYAQRIAAAVLEDAALQARGDISFWTRGVGWWFPDETESLADLDDWLSPKHAASLASTLGLKGRERQQFMAQPKAWISERYDWPEVYWGLMNEWQAFLNGGKAAMRKRLAIKYTFEQRGEIDPDVQRLAAEAADRMLFDWEPRMLFE